MVGNSRLPEPLSDDVQPAQERVRRTPSEEYLFRISQAAFLSLWAHPNVYTDESKPANKGVGTELCDLLVVFGNDVIVFSDKHIGYKETGQPLVDWSRWYRRAIKKSVDQLLGARSWLQRFPGRLFLDPLCRTPFPIRLVRMLCPALKANQVRAR
jgi:hypothetical protein